MLVGQVLMMMVDVMMVLEGAEVEEELYSSILQDLLILRVQLMPEAEQAEIMAEIPVILE